MSGSDAKKKIGAFVTLTQGPSRAVDVTKFKDDVLPQPCPVCGRINAGCRYYVDLGAIFCGKAKK